tara:strand:+ start:1010 stop:1375 length:366 start_codon:yes stop_codon:yes gene_type:complete
MKANELRLGNWVMFRNSETGLFENDLPIVDVQELLYIEDRTFDVEPIPITDEWLVKFGVKWIDETGYGWIDGNYHFNAKKFKNGRIDIWINSNLVNNRKTKYVHQLQNLYFALTGEELKIN